MVKASKTRLRDTFGIIDNNTGKIYPDITHYYLVSTTITDIKLLPNSVLHYDNEAYPLHLDSRLKRRLKRDGIVKVIVSFQKRITGMIALARIHKDA